MARGLLHLVTACLIALLPVSAAFGQDTLAKVGLVLPLEGRGAEVARRIEFGAMLAAGTMRDRMRVVLVSGGCDEEGLPKIIETLRSAEVASVVGPPCFAGARAIADGLNGETPVPVLALDTRSSALARARDVDNLPLLELGPGPESEARAVVEHLLPRFVGRPFAIVDDGSVYGRGLADAVRLAADEAGLRPVANENFRPLQTRQAGLIRRLAQSGVEAVFIAAEPEDVLTVAIEIFRYQPDWLAGAGEAARLVPLLEGAQRLRDGLLVVAPSDLAVAEGQALGAGIDMAGLDVEDSLLMGYAAMQIAAELALTPRDPVGGAAFETAIGPIAFGADGRASLAPYTVLEMRDGALQPLAP